MSRLSPERWKAVSPYLDRALELDTTERTAWFEALMQEDAGLAADVRSLLQQADRLQHDGFLQGGALQPPRASLAGQVLGAYTLESLIGQGGMGGVWLARRSDGRFEGRVAVKLLNASLVGRAGEERFRREGSILARLTHAHIARLFDAGVSPSGQPFLVLEHVEGEPIDRYCDARELGVEARIRLFLDVLAAVAHAHASLIVHRDIKPSNVLVSRDGRVKLLDFGIAKLLEPEPGGDGATALTRDGVQALTPAYAAPEQLAGEPVTTATDVHGLGLLLYLLLVGRHPAAAALHSPAALLQAVLETEPPRPSDAVVHAPGETAEGLARAAGRRGVIPDRLRRQLMGDLDTIIGKALKKRPEERYTSVVALADDLQRALDHQPIRARRDSLSYRAAQFARRHRRGVAAGAATLALFLALAGFYTARLAAERDRARLEAEKAAQMAKVASEHAQRAEAVRRFMVGVFEQARPDHNRGQALSARQILERGEQQVEGRLAAQPALRADVTALLGQLHGELSDFNRARTLLTRALEISGDPRVPVDVRARVLLGMAVLDCEVEAFGPAIDHAQQALALFEGDASGIAEEIARAHEVVARSMIGLGDVRGAEAKLRQTIPGDTAALGEISEPLGDQWVQLGVALGEMGRYDESEQAFRRALRILGALFGENSHSVAYVLNEMSNMLDDKGDLAGSEEALRRMLKIWRETVGPLHHDTLAGEHNLLVVMEYRGHYAEALPERLQLLRRRRKAGFARPLDAMTMHTALGIDYRELGRLREAEAELRQALAVVTRSQGRRSPRGTNARHHLGLVLLIEGRYREAEAMFREALSIERGHDPPTGSVMAVRHADLGTSLRLQHRHAEALAELQQAAALLEGLTNRGDRSRPLILAQLSEAQTDAGDAAAAESTARSALAFGRQALAEGHPFLAQPLVALARALRARQRPAEAEPVLREALAVRARVCPASDVRVLEVKAELVASLALLGRTAEADALRKEVEPPLRASSSPYAANLLKRIARR